MLRHPTQIRRQGKSDSDQHGAEGQNHPIRQHPLPPMPRGRDFPNFLQMILDRQQQQNCRDNQSTGADRGRLGGARCHRLEPRRGLLPDIRCEISQQHGQKAVAGVVEKREAREYRQRDGNQRHQRHDRRVAQCTGRDQATVLDKLTGATACEFGKPAPVHHFGRVIPASTPAIKATTNAVAGCSLANRVAAATAMTVVSGATGGVLG